MKKNRYKATITLKSGKTLEITFKTTKQEFTDSFSSVLDIWSGSSRSGFLFVDYNYISLNEIVHYRVKKLRFYFF